jgi:hypothetical protein
MALSYANQNGGDVAGANIVITSVHEAGDTSGEGAAERSTASSAKCSGGIATNITAQAGVSARPRRRSRRADGRILRRSLIRTFATTATSRNFNVPTTLNYDKMGAPVPSACSTSTAKAEPWARARKRRILRDSTKYLGLGRVQVRIPTARIGVSRDQNVCAARSTPTAVQHGVSVAALDP